MKIEIAGTGYVSLSNTILRRSNVGADICIAITPTNRSPYFNMVKRLSDNSIELVNEAENKIFRRQDAPEVFDITTVVYVADAVLND